MTEMRSALEKAGIKGGGGMSAQKKCKCGNTIKDPKHDTCYSCFQKGREGDSVTSKSNFKIPDNYLKDGYFDQNNCLYEELLTTIADQIASAFSSSYPKLKNHQLRRFYQHARAAENRLKMTHDWPCVNVDIKKLKAFVAEAKGKGKVSEVFYEFINMNLDNIKDEKSFLQGFLEHFQAIVAYFTYYNPKD